MAAEPGPEDGASQRNAEPQAGRSPSPWSLQNPVWLSVTAHAQATSRHVYRPQRSNQEVRWLLSAHRPVPQGKAACFPDSFPKPHTEKRGEQGKQTARSHSCLFCTTRKDRRHETHPENLDVKKSAKENGRRNTSAA